MSLPQRLADVTGSAPVLDVAAVTRRFGEVVAVDGVSLSAGPGEIVCLVGPSGCGKTTLLRMVAGLEPLQSGIVRLAGSVVADAGGGQPPEARGVGLVFQDYALFPHLTVLQNVRFGLSRLPARKQIRQASAMLDRVGMGRLSHVFPHTLSGGQQQRVALARALAPEPNLLLMDEPFSGLDLNLRRSVRDETLDILKESGAATLIVTHDPEEAMYLADRIALMREGRIVQIGSPLDLYCRPADAFSAGFFGEVNRLVSTVAGGHAQTPWGPLDAPGLEDGADAAILIRPEALSVTGPSDPAGAVATVAASKPLGRSTIVHLVVTTPNGPQNLVARIPGMAPAYCDTTVAIRLDPSQAFVFRAESR